MTRKDPEPINLHPYDGIDRRYMHTDPDTAQGRAVVAQILGLAAPPAEPGLRYDLSIYSGGIGVLDKLAVSLPSLPELWSQVRATVSGRTPEDLAADHVAGVDFRWLIMRNDVHRDVREAATTFVNAERAAFQALCAIDDELLFSPDSTVNDWTAVWRHDNQMNFLGFSHG